MLRDDAGFVVLNVHDPEHVVGLLSEGQRTAVYDVQNGAPCRAADLIAGTDDLALRDQVGLRADVVFPKAPVHREILAVKEGGQHVDAVCVPGDRQEAGMGIGELRDKAGLFARVRGIAAARGINASSNGVYLNALDAVNTGLADDFDLV